MRVTLDLETFSAAPIAAGIDVYSTHPSTGVHCAVFGWDAPGGPRTLRWSPPHPDDEGMAQESLPPAELVPWMHNPSAKWIAHNASFEFSIWQNVLAPRYGWPAVPPADRWIDTMQLAAVCNLPASLGTLAASLGTAAQKDEEGKALMQQLCVATEVAGGYRTPRPTPEHLARLLDYCERDVLATMAAFARLAKMAGVTYAEVQLMAADREINQRGVCVDRRLLQRMLQVVRVCEADIGREVFRLTGDSLGIGAPALKQWLAEQGIELPHRRPKKGEAPGETPVTVDKRAVAKWLADPDLPAHVRALLEQRTQAGKVTSLGKLKRVPAMLGADHRLRWSLSYCGAHTGRWTSYGVQLHNLPKPKLKTREAAFREAIMQLQVDTAREIEPSLMSGLSWLLRSLFIAAPGCELIGADYSAIEARVLAWLAGQADVLNTFRRGDDIYVADAASIGSTNRDLGKVCRLGLGYGMGAATFLQTAADWGTPLAAKEATRVHKLWRAANPMIVALWKALQDAALDVTRDGGTVHIGPHLKVSRDKCALLLTLPSGRVLRYWRPEIHTAVRRIVTLNDEGQTETKDVETTELRFFRPQKGAMMADATYGGKLVENATQAVARDLLGAALVRLRGTHYRVVLHVHDSVVAEVPAGTGEVTDFTRRLCQLPDWAHGLPMKAEGYRSPWFRG